MKMTHQLLDEFDDAAEPLAHSFKQNDQVDAFVDGEWRVCKIVNTTEPLRVKVRVFHEPHQAAEWVPFEKVDVMWTRVDPANAMIEMGMKVFSKSYGLTSVVAVRNNQVVVLVDDWLRILMRSDLIQNPKHANDVQC
jgi:hypothetical protein